MSKKKINEWKISVQILTSSLPAGTGFISTELVDFNMRMKHPLNNGEALRLTDRAADWSHTNYQLHIKFVN